MNGMAWLIAAAILVPVLWSTFWKFYNWKTRWRVGTKPDYSEEVEVCILKGFGDYSSNKVRIGKLKPFQEDFYERLHELRALAEERAKELNELDKEFRVK